MNPFSPDASSSDFDKAAAAFYRRESFHLMELMTAEDLAAYFKCSPNTLRGIVREIGLKCTPWTRDSRRKTYLRRDLYEAVGGSRGSSRGKRGVV